MNEPELYTREEAAKTLRISIGTLDNLLRDKKIPHYKFGTKRPDTVRIKVADVEKFIEDSLVIL